MSDSRDEIIERAARADWEWPSLTQEELLWSTASEIDRKDYRKKAQAVLDAVGYFELVEAAKDWRANWCVPLRVEHLSAANRDQAKVATRRLCDALDALEESSD